MVGEHRRNIWKNMTHQKERSSIQHRKIWMRLQSKINTNITQQNEALVPNNTALIGNNRCIINKKPKKEINLCFFSSDVCKNVNKCCLYNLNYSQMYGLRFLYRLQLGTWWIWKVIKPTWINTQNIRLLSIMSNEVWIWREIKTMADLMSFWIDLSSYNCDSCVRQSFKIRQYSFTTYRWQSCILRLFFCVIRLTETTWQY